MCSNKITTRTQRFPGSTSGVPQGSCASTPLSAGPTQTWTCSTVEQGPGSLKPPPAPKTWSYYLTTPALWQETGNLSQPLLWKQSWKRFRTTIFWTFSHSPMTRSKQFPASTETCWCKLLQIIWTHLIKHWRVWSRMVTPISLLPFLRLLNFCKK